MKSNNFRHHKRRNSGQVLIITSLVVVLLLLSTVVYVMETQKNAPVYQPDFNSNLRGIKQAALHTVISALANVTNGGDPTVLDEDLNQLKSAVESNSYNAISDLEFSSLNPVPYVNGLWVAWETEGEGISSASVSFVFNSSGLSAGYYSEFAVNVTSTIGVEGYFSQLNETVRQVTLTCFIRNEGKAAQPGTLSLYYQQDNQSEWIQPITPIVVDCGNGTCVASFLAENSTENTLTVSVHVRDSRGVSIWTKVTCSPR